MKSIMKSKHDSVLDILKNLHGEKLSEQIQKTAKNLSDKISPTLKKSLQEKLSEPPFLDDSKKTKPPDKSECPHPKSHRTHKADDAIKWAKVAEHCISNFELAFKIQTLEAETGLKYPHCTEEKKFYCDNRSQLDSIIKEAGSAYELAIGPVNKGHDLAKTPLHDAPLASISSQVSESTKESLSPFQPNKYSLFHELENAKAFMKAAQDPDYREYANQNFAGAFIHLFKGLVEGAIVHATPFEDAIVSWGPLELATDKIKGTKKDDENNLLISKLYRAIKNSFAKSPESELVAQNPSSSLMDTSLLAATPITTKSDETAPSIIEPYSFEDTLKTTAKNIAETIPELSKIIEEQILKYILEFNTAKLESSEETSIFKTIQENSWVFKFIEKDISKHPRLYAKAVIINPNASTYLSEKQKNDFDFMLEAVKANGLVLKEVGEKLHHHKRFKELVICAVQQNARAIEYVDTELRNDPDLMYNLWGTSKGGGLTHAMIIQYGGPDVRNNELFSDKEFINVAVRQNGLVLEFLPKYQNDPDIVKIAVQQNGLALKFTTLRDISIVFPALKQNGLSLRFAGKVFQDDEEAVTLATTSNPKAILFASEKLRNNESFILKLIKKNPRISKYIPSEMKNSPKILTALEDTLILEDKLRKNKTDMVFFGSPNSKTTTKEIKEPEKNPKKTP
ncbi:hypothetical protein Lgra_3295 [Legionella gratiana]|uniref:DUF4116 domain-containing protein n=2 Tax=Legionella gratiana TaxID=45066 RepID=A0A378JD18_9GAMM|nr:hypothetical protein Lgra_3295 [Legionella gratiana]STX45339.1 Uncharacterised protein [Legionella gratiana]